VARGPEPVGHRGADVSGGASQEDFHIQVLSRLGFKPAVKIYWIEKLGTTLVVLLVGSMMLWSEAMVRGWRLILTIASAVLVYVAGLMLLGRKGDPHGIAWWPFAAAGFAAGAVGELINAKFLVTGELVSAGLTGVVIGTAQWAALRIWIRTTRGGVAR
jgi:hypothetical protein